MPKALCVFSVLAVGVSTALLALPGKGVLYGSDGKGGHLLTIDPATGISTVIGPVTGSDQIRSLATNPVTGVLYAGTGGNHAYLYEVDPVTGLGTFIGDTGLGKAMISGMDFGRDGHLYASINLFGSGGTGGDTLATIDPATGHATLIGAFGSCSGGTCTIEGIEGIAFDLSGHLWGVLRGESQSSGAPGLYRIDTGTGHATFITPVDDASGAAVRVVSLQFACGGTLYGGTGGAGTLTAAPTSAPPTIAIGFLATINPATGLLTYVGSTSATGGTYDLSGLAFSESCGPPGVPALSLWSLALLGLLIAAAAWFVLARR